MVVSSVLTAAAESVETSPIGRDGVVATAWRGSHPTWSWCATILPPESSGRGGVTRIHVGGVGGGDGDGRRG
jgi:hypothetical protein